MLLLGKTQKKHPGDLPPMVPDLPLHPQYLFASIQFNIINYLWPLNLMCSICIHYQPVQSLL